MIDYLIDADTQLFLFFNGMHVDYLDRFMMIFTGRFVWVPMYAALLYVVLRDSTPRRAITTVLCVVLAIVLADQFCGHLLRPLVGRLRPSNLENPVSAMAQIVDGYRGGMYGFPSCHAANSFALAAFCALLLRTRRSAIFIFIWAAMNSYSRLYLGVHYPGDLLAGAFFGVIFGWLCFRLSVLVDRGSWHDEAGWLGKLRVSDFVMLSGIATAAVIAVAALF